MLLCLEAAGGRWASLLAAQAQVLGEGAAPETAPPPRRSETEKGIEEVREGTPFGDGVWMLAAMSESLHRFL